MNRYALAALAAATVVLRRRKALNAQSSWFWAVGLGLLFRKMVQRSLADCDAKTAAAELPAAAYKDQVVWITGASSGIGRALALKLAQQGAKLIISSRREDALNDVKQELALPEEHVRVLPVDLEDVDALPDIVKEALACFGHIDVMINNGGMSTRDLARTTSFDVDMKIMKVDYLAHARISKELLPSMINRQKGCFINIASVAGKLGLPTRTAYSAAKFAMVGFFDALRTEEASSGITVCNVCPGAIATNISKNALTGDGSAFGVTDPFIGNGISASRCADRILAGAYTGLDELWIAKGKELAAFYLGQYAPSLSKLVLRQQAKKLIEAQNQARNN